MDDLFTEADPVRVVRADSLVRLKKIPEAVFDAVVSDPPYGLEFMGKTWDGADGFRRSLNRNDSGRENVFGRTSRKGPECRAGNLFQEWCHAWGTELVRVLKPGGYAVVFGGTRTYHRLACALEDAGFEIRDCLMWVYGTGFPKGKGCLKPAYEPILLCRRPGPKVLPLGVDECRVPAESRLNIVNKPKNGEYAGVSREGSFADGATSLGRWPANVLHDGSDEVMEAFAAFGDRPSGSRKAGEYQPLGLYANGIGERPDGMERVMPALHGSAGTAARFFYCAKASKADRGDGNTHPTVKPIALMRWLVRLVCPAGGLVLDPFGGSGTTGVACVKEGRLCLMIEKNKEYAEIARARVAKAVQIRNQKPDLGVV